MAAPPSEAGKLEAVAEELLKRLEMQVELRRVGRVDVREIRQPLRREPAYFARVWIAFGKPGTALHDLLFVSHNASAGTVPGTPNPTGSELTMVDTTTLRRIAVAAALR